jgi:hypothetical protein
VCTALGTKDCDTQETERRVGEDTKIMQAQNKFALHFKDVMFLKEMAMFGETNTGKTYNGDLLSSVLSEPFTFDNVIQIIKT